MTDAWDWLLFLAGFAALPILAVASVVLHFKLRLRSTIVLATGLVVTVVGELLQLFTPFQTATFEEALETTIAGELPAIWYIGGAVCAVGILLTCIGFVWLSVTAHRVMGRDI